MDEKEQKIILKPFDFLLELYQKTDTIDNQFDQLKSLAIYSFYLTRQGF